jgi:hypothetical protein
MRPGRPRRVVLSLVCVALAAAAAGCEKANDENIDKWMGTQQGPDKLAKALNDPSIDPALSAHAAENLLKINKDADVRHDLDQMQVERRTAVVAKLAPRLWSMARVEGAMTVPTALQTTAKDTLFDVRKYADPDTRTAIDGYLMDWYTSGYYEGRATLGRHLGSTVIRTLGPAAGDKLKHAANRAVAAPAKNGQRTRIGDELLLGMAASGNADAVAYVLDIYEMDRGDPSLKERCVSALFRAYVDPGGLFDIADPKALQGSVGRLAAILKDDSQPPRVIDDATALVRAAGMPGCLDPLIGMMSSGDSQRRWVGANSALRCGGPRAIAPVAAALPTDGHYDHAELKGAVWGEVGRMSPHADAVGEARKLLDSPSWVARWIGAESLAALKSKDDLGRLRKLTGDRARLVGYWGPQDDVPKAERKKDPTLGERAAELVKSLASGA